MVAVFLAVVFLVAVFWVVVFLVASIAIFVVSIATTHSENGRENIKFFDALKNEYHARLGADD